MWEKLLDGDGTIAGSSVVLAVDRARCVIVLGLDDGSKPTRGRSTTCVVEERRVQPANGRIKKLRQE